MGLPWQSSGWGSKLPLPGGHGFDPWSGTGILHVVQHGQKNQKTNKKTTPPPKKTEEKGYEEIFLDKRMLT